MMNSTWKFSIIVLKINSSYELTFKEYIEQNIPFYFFSVIIKPYSKYIERRNLNVK